MEITTTDTIKFKELYELNVNKVVEKKGSIKYLSWAWAWAEFVKIYPNARYEVIKNQSGMPYFKDESGAFCYTRVNAGGVEHEMWLPVMDNKNQSIKSPSAFEINKTIMRCLTKNLAMFGLGLYLYAGEDLPTTDTTASKALPSKTDFTHFTLKGLDGTSIACNESVTFDHFLNKLDAVDSHESFMQYQQWSKLNYAVKKVIFEKNSAEGEVLGRTWHLKNNKYGIAAVAPKVLEEKVDQGEAA